MSSDFRPGDLCSSAADETNVFLTKEFTHPDSWRKIRSREVLVAVETGIVGSTTFVRVLIPSGFVGWCPDWCLVKL